jgi:hypothetical protein
MIDRRSCDERSNFTSLHSRWRPASALCGGDVARHEQDDERDEDGRQECCADHVTALGIHRASWYRPTDLAEWAGPRRRVRRGPAAVRPAHQVASKVGVSSRMRPLRRRASRAPRRGTIRIQRPFCAAIAAGKTTSMRSTARAASTIRSATLRTKAGCTAMSVTMTFDVFAVFRPSE